MFAAWPLLSDERDERPAPPLEVTPSVERGCQLRVVVEEAAPQLRLSSVVRRIERAKGTNVRQSPDNTERVFEATVSIDDVATALRAMDQVEFVTDASITSCE